jgi:hypothetical protein
MSHRRRHAELRRTTTPSRPRLHRLRHYLLPSETSRGHPRHRRPGNAVAARELYTLAVPELPTMMKLRAPTSCLTLC